MSVLPGSAKVFVVAPRGAATPASWRLALGRIARAWAERRAIRHLDSLNDAMLKDIGLSRADLPYAARHGRDWADPLRR